MTITDPGQMNTVELLALQIDEEAKYAKEPYFIDVVNAILTSLSELHYSAFGEEPTIENLATYIRQEPDQWASTVKLFEEIAKKTVDPQSKQRIETALDLERGNNAYIRNMRDFPGIQITSMEVLRRIVERQRAA